VIRLFEGNFFGSLSEVARESRIWPRLSWPRTENALKNGLKFDNLIPKAINLGRIRGQQKAKDAACIAAAGGNNFLTLWSI